MADSWDVTHARLQWLRGGRSGQERVGSAAPHAAGSLNETGSAPAATGQQRPAECMQLFTAERRAHPNTHPPTHRGLTASCPACARQCWPTANSPADSCSAGSPPCPPAAAASQAWQMGRGTNGVSPSPKSASTWLHMVVSQHSCSSATLGSAPAGGTGKYICTEHGKLPSRFMRTHGCRRRLVLPATAAAGKGAPAAHTHPSVCTPTKANIQLPEAHLTGCTAAAQSGQRPTAQRGGAETGRQMLGPGPQPWRATLPSACSRRPHSPLHQDM